MEESCVGATGSGVGLGERVGATLYLECAECPEERE